MIFIFILQDKLLILGRHGGMVFDLSGNNLTCMLVRSLPDQLSADLGIGGLFHDKIPVVIGNSMYSKRGESEIFTYDPAKNDWDKSIFLFPPTTGAVSAMINQGKEMFVAGGERNTTWYLSLEKGYRPGPQIPSDLDSFSLCMVKINDTTLLLVGVQKESPAADFPRTPKKYRGVTYFFNVNGQTWTKGPDLIHPRTRPSCAQIDLDNDHLWLWLGQ